MAAALEKMRKKIKTWEGHTYLRELDIPAADLAKIAKNVTGRRAFGRLKRLPGEDVEAILRLAF